MVDTTASLDLQGKGNLPKYLEDLNKQFTDLNKVTETQTKGFSDLNKVGTETGGFVEKLLKTVQDFAEVTGQINKGSKDTLDFLTNTGKATIDLDENLGKATSGMSGFLLGFTGLKDEAVRLDSAISPLAGNFRDIAEAQGTTAKAFVILDKTSKPIVGTLNAVSDRLEVFEKGLRNSEQFVASFAQTVTGVGSKSLLFFSNSFRQLSEDLKSSSLVGRLFAGSFETVSESLEKSAKSVGNFSKNIDPEKLQKVDAVGEGIANTFNRIGEGVDRLSIGVKLADFVGDISRASTGIKNTATEIGTTATDSVRGFGDAAKYAIPLYFGLNTKFQIAAQGAGLLAKTTGSELLGALSGVASKLGNISIAAGSFVALTNGAADAYIQAQGLSDTFDVMQSLGIDTTAASIAFQFGLVGEKLLFSSQAAKEFGKTAITAFAQLEDAAAFVTTIGAGAGVQLEGLEAGVESISAAMTELAGNLDNAVSSTEATNALYNALSAGVGIAADNTVRLSETNEFLSASLKLSAGSGADAAQTLELLAKTSQIYGLSNTEAATTAAKLYGIVEEGITTFPQLTSELGSVLSVAQPIGVSMEEVGGALAALTKTMGSTAEATTGLQSLLAAIAGQGEQAQKALQEIGVRFDVNTIKSKGLINALQDLYKATGGNASALKEIIPDQLAFRTALTLSNSAAEDAKSTFESISETGPEALDELFGRRQQSTVQQFSLIMNGFNEVLVDFGRRALPAIQPGVDLLQGLLNILQSLPDPIKNAIGAIVLAQTAISNIGGGLLSFGLTIAQIVAGIAGFRLASKLLGGQLGKEFETIKAINSEGFNLAGTFLRLIGLNEKFDLETAKANATLKAQKNLLKDLSKTDLDFTGDISNISDLGNALSQVRNRIQEVKSGGLQQIDALSFEKEIKNLERLEKKIQKVINTTSGVRDNIFTNLQKTIDQALSNVELDIDKRREALKKSLDNYLVTFGNFGDKAKTEIDQIFRDIISNEALSTADKVEIINAKFKELGQDVPSNIRNNFQKVNEELVEAVQRLDGNFDGELSKVKTRLGNFFSNLIPENAIDRVKASLGNLDAEIEIGLAAIGGTSQKLRDQIEAEFKNILGDAEATTKEKVARINAYFEQLIDESIPENRADLRELQTNMSVGLARIERETRESVSKINTQFEKIGETAQKSINKTGRAFGSLGDLVSNFVPGVGIFTSVARDAGDVIEDFSDAFPKLGKKAVNSTKSLSLFGKSTKVLGANSVVATKSVGIFGKVFTSIGSAAGLAGKAIGFLSSTFSGLLAAIAPFLAPLGIAVAGLYALHNVLKILVPAYANATDGNIKLANSLKESNKDIEESTRRIQKLTKTVEELAVAGPNAFAQFESDAEKAALADLSDEAITNLTGATTEQIAELRKEVIKASIPEEKAFVQGWRAPLLNVVEFVTQSIVKIGFVLRKLPLQIGKTFIDLGKNITERIPIIGDQYEKLAQRIGKALFDIERDQGAVGNAIRERFNDVRENIQAAISGPARKAALESREAVTGLIIETNKLTQSYTNGGVAFAESQKIIKQASDENRALRAEEISFILENEKKANELAREEIQETIAKKQEELEKAKDPVVKEELERQVDELQKRNIELEKGLALQEKYLNNAQALLSARDQNQAERGVEDLERRVRGLYTDLSDEAKDVFKGLPGAALDAAGEVDQITGNLSSSAQRRAQAGFEAARASFSQTVVDISDPLKQVSPDKLSTDLFSVLESVDAQVAEQVLSLEDGKKAKEQFLNQIVEVEIDGQVQTGFAREFLRADQIKAVEENLLESSQQIAEKNIKIKERELGLITDLEKQGKITSLEAARETAEANENINNEKIKAAQEFLNTNIELYGKDSQAAQDAQKELEALRSTIAVQGFEDRKKILDEELKLLQQQKDNEFEVIKQSFEKENALNELRTKSINIEQSALNAQQELASAISNLQVTGLQNRLKFIGDIEEKAQAELEIAQARLSTLGVEQEFERQNLELQQELNKLSLEREKSTLRNTEAQLQNNLAIAQAKLAQVEQLNLTEEETTALNLQVSSIQQQLSINGQQQTQLEKQGQIQEEINQKQEQSLKLKQQAAQETSAAEVELAELEKVLAGYEKQKQVIANNAKEQSMSAEGRKLALDKQTAILDQQTQILEKQFEIVKQTSDLTSSYFDLAKQQATNSFRQRRLEREAAKVRRDNMEQIQKLEQSNLAIQQQQRDIALQRKTIELDIARIEKESQLAQAEADFAAVQADPRATAEQRRASQLNVVAQQRGLEGIQQQQELLGIERSFNQFINQQERVQQRQQQQFDLLQADSAVAETTLSRGDDARISRRAQQQARENNEQLNSLVGTFTETAADFSQNVNAFTSVGTIATSGRPGGALVSTANNISPTSTGTRQPVSVNGQVSVTVDIKGNTDGVNKTELQKSISDGFYRSMNELLDYSIRRQS
jgi:TP901 family phage tail tape measure protein